jgi:plastocyanin
LRIHWVALAGALALLATAPGSVAAPAQEEVSIEFSDYRPDQLDVLPGQAVLWTNVSVRTHTVTSDTGVFDSGNVAPEGGQFSFLFSQVGTYAYHCTIHPSIVGEVDVRRVILDSLPPAVVPVGSNVDFTGRTADPSQPVAIQRRVQGDTFATAATATPTPDGAWKTTLKADATGDYRAVSGADASQIRRLLVSGRKVRVQVTRTGLSVTTVPSAPYGRFLVQEHLRARFGWFPVASGRLNYVSVADVRVARPASVRIVLVDQDGWTPLATSRVVVLR